MKHPISMVLALLITFSLTTAARASDAWKLLHGRGVSALKAGQYPEAEKQFRLAVHEVAKSPSGVARQAASLLGLATAFHKEGMRDKATRALKLAAARAVKVKLAHPELIAKARQLAARMRAATHAAD